jgi:hypothetical protein
MKIWRARARLVVELAVVFYVVAQSYDGRLQIRSNAVAGCERGKADRVVNAVGWRTAEAARRASGTPSDLVAAARYDRVASSLEQRSRLRCSSAYPKPTLLP